MVGWSAAGSTELLNLQTVERPGMAHFLLRRLCPFLSPLHLQNRQGRDPGSAPLTLKNGDQDYRKFFLVLQQGSDFRAVNLSVMICPNHSWAVKFFWRRGKCRVFWSRELCRTSFTEHTLWTLLFGLWLFLLLAKYLPKWHILYEEKSVFHVHCSSPSRNSRCTVLNTV